MKPVANIVAKGKENRVQVVFLLMVMFWNCDDVFFKEFPVSGYR